MKFMKHLIATIILLSTLISYSLHSSERDYPKALSDTLQKSLQSISEKHPVQPGSFSISMSENKVKYLRICVDTTGPLSIEKLRPMMVDSIKIILDALNSDKKNIPYLSNSLATEDNITLSITILDKDSKWLDYPEIAAANFIRGNLMYVRFQTDEMECITQTTLLNETYAEALEKLQNESQD